MCGWNVARRLREPCHIGGMEVSYFFSCVVGEGLTPHDKEEIAATTSFAMGCCVSFSFICFRRFLPHSLLPLAHSCALFSESPLFNFMDRINGLTRSCWIFISFTFTSPFYF